MSALDQLKMSFVLGDKVIEAYPVAEVDDATENLEADIVQRDQRIATLEQSALIDGATLAEQHARIVELESTLAQRDQRIAELEADRLYCWAEAETDPQCGLSLDEAIRHAMRKARAEVPEWCSGLLLAMHAAGQLTLTPNQLRACGIEVP